MNKELEEFLNSLGRALVLSLALGVAVSVGTACSSAAIYYNRAQSEKDHIQYLLLIHSLTKRDYEIF